MRALELLRPALAAEMPLRLTERAEPAPGPGELLLRVAACAVCRTDLQLVEGDLAARRLPIVPGHQAVGRVAAIGSGVTGWSIGDRAGAYWLFGTDGSCRFCQSGRENLCRAAEFTGWDRDGGFAEAMVVRADVAVRIPDEFADLDAAPLLCGGVIGYRALRVSGLEPGGRLGLYGFGASALLCIQVARHWGCEVHVRARSETERQRALELGAASVGDYGDPAPPLDAAITTAPAGDVVVAALRAVDRGGIVAVNAIHLDRVPEFPYDWLWWERQIRSVANVTRRDAAEFMALAASIPIRTTVDVFPLEAGNDALQALAAGRIRGAAVLTTRSE
ncbi:MAG: zinc-dependent alcohol dehydrogenase family protein [Candidatus Limnocylindrales bacterium]